MMALINHPGLPKTVTATRGGLGNNVLLLLLAAFCGLGLIQILNHPLWQDEWQAWLIARDSGSLAGLFHNFRYDGHPGLWYLTLYLLSRFTTQPLAMQLFHLALATAAVWVFLRFSPFTRLQKILFVFGYFPFFEYAVISRNYAFGVLLIFTYCAVLPREFPKKYLVLGGLLFLLCQTSVYGVLVALALGTGLVFGELWEKRNGLIEKQLLPPHPSPLPQRGSGDEEVNTFPYLSIIALSSIMGLGVGLAILQLAPPPDSGFAVGWRLDWDWPVVLRTLGIVWDSFVPLPSLQMHFWNTNLIGQPYLKFFLSLVLLVFSVLLLRRQPAVLALFALGVLALLSFTYTKYPGSLRHHGHLFILFVAALWLSGYYPDRPGKAGKIAEFGRQHRNTFISTLLAAQLAAGFLAAGLSLCYPFSAGKETARYIQDQGLSGRLLAGDEDDAASVISGYLQQPVYYLGANRWGTFVIWDQQRKSLEVTEAWQRARQLAARQRQEVLLILNRELNTPEAEIIRLKQFSRSIVPSEAYYLYLLKYPGERQSGATQ